MNGKSETTEDARDMVERYLGTLLRWVEERGMMDDVAAMNIRRAATEMVETALAKPR
jgi:hypothetical protein